MPVAAPCSLLVVYPYANLDSNPTMALLLESLAARGVKVDVLMSRGTGHVEPASFGATVRVEQVDPVFFFRHFDPTPKALLKRLPLRVLIPRRHALHPLRLDPAVFGLLQAKRYSIIAGADPAGIVLADGFNRTAKRPLVYLNFELLFAHDADDGGHTADLVRLERAACGRVDLALLQDDERAGAFCKDKGFPMERVAMVPVAPPPSEVKRTDWLRRKLGIAPERRIVLYMGSFENWTSYGEFGEMVSYWDKRFCLVIHSRAAMRPRLRRFLKRYTDSGMIYISSEPVPRDEFLDVVASADYGLASYKPYPDYWGSDDNLYHLGLSSGKVAYYAMCGLPILARPLPVFEREFARYDCGRVYPRLAQTGDLLAAMDRNYEHHSREARRFYSERLNPVPGMKSFCDRLLKLSMEQVRGMEHGARSGEQS